MRMSIAARGRGTLYCVTSSDAPPTSRRALRARADRERAAAATAEPASGDKNSPASEAPPTPVSAAAAAAAPADTASDSAAAFASTYAAEASAWESTTTADAPTADAAVAAPVSASAASSPSDAGARPLQRVALAWVDPDEVATRRAPRDLTAASSTFVPVLPDILPRPRRRRSAGRVLAPLAAVAVLAGGYTAATQLWTLDNVDPAVTAAAAPALAAPASEVSWPADGIAAVGVEGMGNTLASAGEADTMASITKLVSVLMVLDRAPVELGETGEEYEIAYSDRVDYWGFLGRGESALDVPVGGTLTQYQLMQGALIASAGNYTEMLTRQFWPTDESFESAAREWLDEHDLDGITVVEPTGIDRGNTADAASLIRLASIALENPVVAEIVATESAEIPGVKTIENTNPLLGDDGVVGIKTGGLIGSYNLLAAREVTVGETVVRVYAAVLDQPTEALRGTATDELLQQVADEVSAPTTLSAGTKIATVTTPWGTDADIVTAADASVILWNTAQVDATTDVDVSSARDQGDTAGELSLAGPIDSASTALTLTADLGAPDAWWRFTHPLELLGIAG